MSEPSPKDREAEARLPEELRPVYRRLVTEYAYCTNLRYGKGYVAYQVIADLILAGWRPSVPPHPDSPV